MKRFPWIQDLQRRLTPVFLVIGVLALAAGPALAQGIPPPASYSPTDANGVNVSTGGFEGPAHTISIGQPHSSHESASTCDAADIHFTYSWCCRY